MDFTTILSKLDGDLEVLDVIVDQFKKNIPEDLALLKKAVEGGDLNKVESISHKMKGLIGYFWDKELTASLQKLMEQGRALEPEGMGSLFHYINEKTDQLLTYFNSEDWRKEIVTSKTTQPE